MIEIFFAILALLSGSFAHHKVHFIPAHVICPNVTSDHDILLPSPHDCSVYYRCENGMAVPETCPAGLEWCEVLSKCTLPILANCSFTHTPVTYSPEDLATINIATPEPNSQICPVNGAVLPNPLNCKSYFECTNEEPVEQSCPDNQEYSCWDQKCVPAESAECIKNVGSGQNCSIEGEKLTNPKDCGSYYQCQDGQVIEKNCASGLLFNSWYGYCVTPDKTNCMGNNATTEPNFTPTSQPTPSPSEENICPIEGALLPNPEDCHKYYICINETPTERTCPEGDEYSCWDQKCVTAESAQCANNIGTGNSCSNEGEAMPNKNDCSSYFICQNGKVEKENCDLGLNFNAWYKKCVPPNLAHCPLTGTDNTSGTEDTTSSSANTGTTNSAGSILCRGNSTGFQYPAFDDCNAYLICDNNKQLKKVKCDPPEYHYNCHTKKCENITHCCNKPPTTQTTNTEGNSSTPTPNSTDESSSQTASIETETTSDLTNPTDTSETTNPTSENSSVTSSETETTKPGGVNATSNPGNDSSSETPNTEGSDSTPTIYSSEETSSQTTSAESKPSTDTTNPTNENSSLTSSATETTTPGDVSATSNTSSESSSETPNTGESDSTPTTNFSEETSSQTSSSESKPSTDITNPTDEITSKPTNSTTENSSITSSETETTEPGGVNATSNPGNESSSETPNTEGSDSTPTINSSEETLSTESKPASDTTNPTDETTSKTTTENNISVSPPTENECPVDGSLLPNPENCTSYYECQNKTPILKYCPEGEEYSCWDQKCEKPTDATCIRQADQAGKSCSNENEKLPNTLDCNTYYKCVDGKVKLLFCAEGLFYNAWLKKCVSINIAFCAVYPPIGSTAPPINTETPSPIEDLCPMAGAKLPNPLDCSTYYICIDKGLETVKCPQGELYSCWDQKCLPDNEAQCISTVERPGEKCFIENLQLPNFKDCSSYYVCHNGKIEQKKCPPNLQYNSKFQKCVDSKLAHCEEVSTFPTQPPTGTTKLPIPGSETCPKNGELLLDPNDCTKYYKCENHKPVSKKCSDGNEFSILDQKCIKSNNNSTCNDFIPQEGQHCTESGFMIPNVLDCGSYFICVKGKLEMQFCSAGTFYNKWFKACLSLSLAFCFTIPPFPTITTPSEKEDICPIEHALIPNPVDCTTYYECFNKTLVLQTCPVDLSYNCWDQRCENSSEAQCVSSPFVELRPCSKNGLKVADVTDCSSYYECFFGKIKKRYCFFGTQFNEKFQRCVPPKYAHCSTSPTLPSTISTNSPATVTPSSDKDLCPEDGALLPNPNNCSTYYKCINGTPTLQLCAEGLEYSCWDMACTQPSEAKCIANGNNVGQTCKKNGQRMPDPENCHSYYECVKGKVEGKTCLGNWKYNKWFQICFPSIFAHCTPSTTIAPKPTSTTIRPNLLKDVCPINGALLPNPTDCSGYYECENNEPSSRKCPQGQEYSCWDQSCEPATNAQCIIVGSQLGKNCSREGERLQNVEDCYSYYECVKGKVEKKYCPLLTKYNKWYQECKLSLFSHCETYKVTANPTEQPITTTTVIIYPESPACPKNGAKVPNPNDCHTYFVCDKRRPVLHSCPEGQNYDCWSRKCVPIILTRCLNVPTAYVGQHCEKNGQTIAKYDNCNQYYKCVDHTIELRTCPIFQQYSIWTNKCELIVLAQCSNNKFLGIL